MQDGDRVLSDGAHACGRPQVSGVRQVPAARAGTLGVVVLSPVRLLPAHRRARAARLLPRLRFFPSARPAARRCLPGGFRPGRSSADGGIEEFPLLRDPARSAAASCSRRSATADSSAAIRFACPAISAACAAIRPPAPGSAHHADLLAEWPDRPLLIPLVDAETGEAAIWDRFGRQVVSVASAFVARNSSVEAGRGDNGRAVSSRPE